MTQIVFAPYVGPRFAGNPVRLMILGESHHGDDPLHSTQTVVEKWQSREWAIRFLTIGARIISGQQAWEIDRQTVFAQIAFYNFIQFLMPHHSHRPTVEQARASWPAFREVLEALDPTHILVTGRVFLWSNLPPSDGTSDETLYEDVFLPRREYLTPSGHAVAVAIPHLTRASAPKWQEPVREFLARPRPESISLPFHFDL